MFFIGMNTHNYYGKNKSITFSYEVNDNAMQQNNSNDNNYLKNEDE